MSDRDAYRFTFRMFVVLSLFLAFLHGLGAR